VSEPAVADAGTRPGFAARSTVAREHRGIRRVCVLALLLCLCSSIVSGAESVRVLALFPGKAMLEVDGKRKVLSAAGDAFRGVKLISADTREAVVEFDGRRETLRLGSSVRSEYKKSTRREIRIVKDRRGGYFVNGLINGQPVNFLVDTGATSIAMSENQAAKLGLQHRVDGRRVGVGTASGNVVAHEIELRSISVAGVRMNDVRAVVIDGSSPRFVLLGMNVLSKFDIDQRENLLVLRTKY
jgi:aspartyl protease family protein